MLTKEYFDNIYITPNDSYIEARMKDVADTIEKLGGVDQRFEKVSCPLCSFSMTRHLVKTTEGSLGVCMECGLVFAHQRVKKELLHALCKYYIPTSLTDQKVRSGIQARFVEVNDEIDLVEKHVEKRGKMLDVGASSGDFLLYARSRGWEVEGTELSIYCIEIAKKFFEIDLIFGELSDITLAEKEYTAITLRHCIEHIRSPVKELNKIYDALKDEGILLITTPEHAKDLSLIKEHHMLPHHIVNYTKGTIKILLYKTGFEIISYESFPPDERGVNNMRILARKVVDNEQ